MITEGKTDDVLDILSFIHIQHMIIKLLILSYFEKKPILNHINININ